MKKETVKSRQHFETINADRLANGGIANSHLYCHLQQLMGRLADDEISHACRDLIGAMNTALLKGESPEKLVRRIGRKRSPKLYNLRSMTREEAKKELVEIRRLRRLAAAHSPIPGARKLEQYHPEIITLYQSDASYRDIQFWLRAKKGLVVSHHSVQRYLKAVLNHDSKEI